MQEINERNLENVTGGSEQDVDMRAAAKRICAKCKKEAPGVCANGSPEQLASQLGAAIVDPDGFNYRQCNYFHLGG